MGTNITHPRVSPRIVGLTVGASCIIGGGLIAAVTSPLQLAKGSWLAAYLVLIAGVAQLLLAQQQHLLDPGQDQRRAEWFTLAFWVLGNAAVITGSLQAAPCFVDAGGVLLTVAIILAWVRIRGTRMRALGTVLCFVYAVIVASIPIGLILAHLRA